MNEIDSLRTAIQNVYGCQADYAESVPVTETFQGRIVWQGTVHVFGLTGYAKAKRCYAWGYWLGGGAERIIAILGEPPIDSPTAAVRAAIVAGSRH